VDETQRLLNSTRADMRNPEYTTFPVLVDENVPVLMAKKIESIMNSRTARLTALVLSATSAFPESYMEHKEE